MVMFRYGSLFRTSLAGRPVIISTDAEVNHYLFLQEGRSVEMWYLDTFAKLFNLDGDSKPTAFGAVHRYVRSIVLKHFGPDTLREKLLPQIEQMIDSTLGIWSLQGSIPVKEAVATVNPIIINNTVIVNEFKPRKIFRIQNERVIFTRVYGAI